MDPITASAAPSLPLSDDVSRVIRDALASRATRRFDLPHRRSAAVMLMLFERAREPWIVLTKRTHTVRSHKGEISFPGGARDETDPDLWQTAVRETCEELGVAGESLEFLGSLDDLPTFSSGYVVSPYVAAFAPSGLWKPNAGEIAEVIEMPLRRLADVGRLETWRSQGIEHPMHIFEVDGHYVWGVTALILRGFLDIVGPAIWPGGECT